VYQRGRAHVDAFSRALEDAGFDTRAYELNTALAATLADPSGKQRAFEQRQHVFPELDGTVVVPEFLDLED
jgi:hypothetical protein